MPESQRDEFGAVNEDSPEVLDSEGPSPGHLDARSGVHDDGLSDDDEIVYASDLERFSSALQEAQRRAILVENEQAKWKRKTPKTYHGDLKKTLACRQKTRQLLAAHDFYDIFTFMALKAKDQTVVGRTPEQNEPADSSCSLPGGGVDVGAESVAKRVRFGDTSIPTLGMSAESLCLSSGGGVGGVEEGLGDANRVRFEDANVGALSTGHCPTTSETSDQAPICVLSTIDESWSPISSPLDDSQARLLAASVSDSDRHTFHEEEESSGEEEPPRLLHLSHTQSESCRRRVKDSDDDDGQSARVVGGKGKGLGKVPHSAAEEEEESTDDSVNSKFVGGSHISAQYRL